IQSGSLSNADLAALFGVEDLNAKKEICSQVTSRMAPSADQGSADFSSEKNPAQTEAAAGVTPTPVLVLSPEKGRLLAQANGSKWSPAHRRGSERVIRTKIPQERYRSAGRLRDVDVKMRLLALWHQSLVRSERSGSWTLFSNSRKGERKKVSYTAET